MLIWIFFCSKCFNNDTNIQKRYQNAYYYLHFGAMITTHTARRSFATNLFLDGVPAITIMKITGHKTEKAFLLYIKITPNENAKILQLHWQKKNKLKAVG